MLSGMSKSVPSFLSNSCHIFDINHYRRDWEYIWIVSIYHQAVFMLYLSISRLYLSIFKLYLSLSRLYLSIIKLSSISKLYLSIDTRRPYVCKYILSKLLQYFIPRVNLRGKLSSNILSIKKIVAQFLLSQFIFIYILHLVLKKIISNLTIIVDKIFFKF